MCYCNIAVVYFVLPLTIHLIRAYIAKKDKKICT